jgi:hypothetical protein
MSGAGSKRRPIINYSSNETSENNYKSLIPKPKRRRINYGNTSAAFAQPPAPAPASGLFWPMRWPFQSKKVTTPLSVKGPRKSNRIPIRTQKYRNYVKVRQQLNKKRFVISQKHKVKPQKTLLEKGINYIGQWWSSKPEQTAAHVIYKNNMSLNEAEREPFVTAEPEEEEEEEEEEEAPVAAATTADGCITEPNILCTLAVSDAHHDFGSSESVAEYAKNNLPLEYNACDGHKQPNLFMQHELSTAYVVGFGFRFNPYNKYMSDYITLDVNQYNLIDSLLAYGIYDVFCVVDTYRTGFKNALINIPDDSGLTFYWVHNKQTMFDPASKTTAITDVGREVLRNKNVKFAYDDYTNTTIYNSWDANCRENNSKFFTKNKVTMHSYNKTQSFAIIHKNGKYVACDSEMAARDAALKESMFIAEISTNLNEYIFNNQYALTPFMMEDKYLVKRLGDQSQALSCTDKTFNLTIHNSKDAKISDLNRHAFVTIDALAMAGAIIYKVPIIIYCYPSERNVDEKKMNLLIRKDVVSRLKREEYLKIVEQKQREQLESDYFEFKNKYKTIKGDLINKITLIMRVLLYTIKSLNTNGIDSGEKANARLAMYLWKIYKNILFLRLKSNINLHYFEQNEIPDSHVSKK